jgi:hypothetical protein
MNLRVDRRRQQQRAYTGCHQLHGVRHCRLCNWIIYNTRMEDTRASGNSCWAPMGVYESRICTPMEEQMNHFWSFPFAGQLTAVWWEDMQMSYTCRRGHFLPSASFHVQLEAQLYVIQISHAIASNFWAMDSDRKPVRVFCVGVARAGIAGAGAGWAVSFCWTSVRW